MRPTGQKSGEIKICNKFVTLIVSGHIKYQKIEKVKGFVLSKKTNEFIVILEENRDLHLRSDKRKDIIITISKIILSNE